MIRFIELTLFSSTEHIFVGESIKRITLLDINQGVSLRIQMEGSMSSRISLRKLLPDSTARLASRAPCRLT